MFSRRPTSTELALIPFLQPQHLSCILHELSSRFSVGLAVYSNCPATGGTIISVGAVMTSTSAFLI